MIIMKRIHLAVAACSMLAVAATVVAMNPESSAMGSGQPSFAWHSFNEAMAQARNAKKLVLLDVYTDWCGYCKKMDREVYADSAVGAFIGERYVASKMNPEKSGTITYKGESYTQREFAQALGINGYPATVFFNTDGEIITVVPGYLPARDFGPLLRFIADGHYKTTSWEEFRKEDS